MEEQKREWTGVWIPKSIWTNEELGWTEKMLLVEIKSLDNEDGCYASNQYFANFFKLSKDRVSKIVTELKRMGYISVELIYKGETKQVDKRVIRVNLMRYEGIGENADGYRQKQRYPLGENADTPIGENAYYNNTLINNTINIKTSCHKFETCDMDNAKMLLELMLINNPNLKKPNLEKWADEFRLIRERDKRTDEQVKYLIDWTQRDTFWRSNILSPSKLRKQWDTLVMRIKEQREKNNKQQYQAPQTFRFSEVAQESPQKSKWGIE